MTVSFSCAFSSNSTITQMGNTIYVDGISTDYQSIDECIESLDRKQKHQNSVISKESNYIMRQMVSEDRTVKNTEQTKALLSEMIKSKTPTKNQKVLSARKSINQNPFGKNELVVEGKQIALSDELINTLTEEELQSYDKIVEKIESSFS